MATSTAGNPSNFTPDQMALVRHDGGCHCGAVRFHFMAPPVLHVYECNCSICTKKQLSHVIVPKALFHLTQGQSALTSYTFNTGQAKHLFCQICGVQSFYVPRSNPDGYSVNGHCVDEESVEGWVRQPFDGQNWEQANSTSDIRSQSKE